MCQRVKLGFYRKRLFDSVGLEEIYWETFEYPYDCTLINVYAWEQLRLTFTLPYDKEDYKGQFYNSDPTQGK